MPEAFIWSKKTVITFLTIKIDALKIDALSDRGQIIGDPSRRGQVVIADH